MSILFPFQGLLTDTETFEQKLQEGALTVISDLKALEMQIGKFKNSDKLQWMNTGNEYYDGIQEITTYLRKIIGEGGALQVALNLPNNRILDNQYAKIVDQKVNYQVGKPITLDGESDAYDLALSTVLNRRFHRTLKNLTTDVFNMGLGFLYPHYNAEGEFDIKRLPANEVLPFWVDAERSRLEYAAHFYTVTRYEADKEVEVEQVDVYGKTGIEHYVFNNSSLIVDVSRNLGKTPYITVVEDDAEGTPVATAYDWARIPLIPFRFNEREIPLIVRTKGLQDAINQMLSTYMNNMQEDSRNTILVIKNYGGQDLGEFRRNLSQFGAVKVETYDGVEGGVDALNIEVNSTNYESILKLLKNAIIENGRGYDAKDERMSNNPNQMNITSMYSDIELDANGIETEYQASFEDLLWFVNRHLENIGQPNFDGQTIDIIFNRDTLVNESEVIKGILDSPYLPLETKLAQHPYVNDVKAELEKLKQERLNGFDIGDNYNTTFEANRK